MNHRINKNDVYGIIDSERYANVKEPETGFGDCPSAALNIQIVRKVNRDSMQNSFFSQDRAKTQFRK